MLLLFWKATGEIGIDAAVLALVAPPADVVVDPAGVGVVLDATACVLTLSAPVALAEQVLAATACVLTLSAPPAVAEAPVGARVTLDASANVLTLSSGVAAVSVDLTASSITIGGVARGKTIRPASLTVTDQLDEQPNLCTFVCHGFVPHVGEEIVITIGSPNNREFAGHLVSVEQIYEGQKPVNVAYHCEAVDYTRLLDRRLVHQRFPAQALAVTVTQIMQGFTAGFDTTNVATDLPTIAEIDFVYEPVTQALTRLAQLAGAYWYVDYFRGLHFFITETVDPPDPVTGPTAKVQTIARTYDLSQVRTQVLVAGQGTETTVDVAVSAGGNLPIADATPFAAGGGLARTNGFQVAYAGKWDGGTITTVQGVSPAIAAPSAAIVAGAGQVLGPTYYRVSFKSPAGETLAGAGSNTVTGVVFAQHGSPTLRMDGPTVGVGRLIGTFRYRTTYLTDSGETAIGDTAGVEVTGSATAFPSPTAPIVNLATGLGVLLGAFSYKVAFVTALGETLPSAAGARTATALPTPVNTVGSLGIVPNAWGALRPGTYRWGYTWVTAQGETLLSPTAALTFTSWTPGSTTFNSMSAAGAGDVLTGFYDYATAYVDQEGGVSFLGASVNSVNVASPGGKTVTLNIPIGPTGTVARRLYRRAGGNWQFVTEVQDNVASIAIDNTKVAGAVFSGGTMGGQATMAIPSTSGLAGVVRARVYRSKIGTSSPLYLVGEAVTNPGSSVTFVDAVRDSDLSVTAPLVATAGGQQHAITIPQGPAGTLARRLYRTAPGGVEYRLLVEVQDNTTGTVVDNVADLTGPAPVLVATAGGQNLQLTVNAYALPPSGARAVRVYRTKAGGAEFFLAAQTNVVTTYVVIVDSKTDDELGDGAPTTNDAGASAVQVSGIPIGPAGTTARRLYRHAYQFPGDATGVDRFVGELPDNTTTAYLDTKATDSLGEPAPTTSTIGAAQGADTLTLASVAGFFPGSPFSGWAFAGSMPVHYASISGTTLLGIPSTGEGSLVTALRAGTEVVAAPMLLNYTAVPYALPTGSPVQVLVVCNDAAAQAAIAAVEGGDGIHQVLIDDDLLTIASATTRGNAELAQFSAPEHRVTFSSRDRKLRSGKTVSINLPPPTNIAGTFKIQQVVITEWGIPNLLPLRTVIASSVLYSFEHLLRRVELLGA